MSSYDLILIAVTNVQQIAAVVNVHGIGDSVNAATMNVQGKVAAMNVQEKVAAMNTSKAAHWNGIQMSYLKYKIRCLKLLMHSIDLLLCTDKMIHLSANNHFDARKSFGGRVNSILLKRIVK